MKSRVGENCFAQSRALTCSKHTSNRHELEANQSPNGGTFSSLQPLTFTLSNDNSPFDMSRFTSDSARSSAVIDQRRVSDTIFILDRLPAELRNIIYELALPGRPYRPAKGSKTVFRSLTNAKVPGLCQLTNLTRKETLPMFMIRPRQEWIWNCFSSKDLSSYAEEILAGLGDVRRIRPQPVEMYPPEPDGTWQPDRESRLFLKFPAHLLRYLQKLLIVGLAGFKERSFAFSVKLDRETDWRSVKVNVIQYRNTKTTLNAARQLLPSSGPTLLNTNLRRARFSGHAFLNNLQKELNKDRHPWLGQGRIGLNKRDMFVIWKSVYELTNGEYFGLDSECSTGPVDGVSKAMKFSGLFEQEFETAKIKDAEDAKIQKRELNRERRKARLEKKALLEPAKKND